MLVLGFLALLLLAGLAGTVVAFRDTLLRDPVRVPTCPDLIASDLAPDRRR